MEKGKEMATKEKEPGNGWESKGNVLVVLLLMPLGEFFVARCLLFCWFPRTVVGVPRFHVSILNRFLFYC